MFNILKRNKPAENPSEKISFFSRLKQGLSKTRQYFSKNITDLFLGKKVLDQEVLDQLETYLISADVGIETTQYLIQKLTDQLARKELSDCEAALKSLQNEMQALLTPVEKPLTLDDTKKPFVILMIGVNGAGKTTTIGKIAKTLQAEGKNIMLAAGDTFRAAAIEQLQVWGERNNIAVVAQQSGADTAAVIYDAIESAKAKKMDVLIADTAGRLHTQTNLIEELKKIERVIKKSDTSAPHETLLVIDASIGQNALLQAKQFNAAIKISGIVITKLDGTAKGGIIFAIAKQLQIPIRYIGIGEGIDDLKPFKSEEFVTALFSMEE